MTIFFGSPIFLLIHVLSFGCVWCLGRGRDELEVTKKIREGFHESKVRGLLQIDPREIINSMK